MEVLNDMLKYVELEELSVENVNLDQELRWQSLDTTKRQLLFTDEQISKDER